MELICVCITALIIIAIFAIDHQICRIIKRLDDIKTLIKLKYESEETKCE